MDESIADQQLLPASTDVAIVGAGFAGLGMAAELDRTGMHDYVVLERAHDVGGTWRDNTYPGAACDVPSQLYSFSRALEPRWSRSFSGQQEILGYLQGFARNEGLGGRLHLGCAVSGAWWDEASSCWSIETGKGRLTARHLVTGTGALSEPRVPAIPGLGTFNGTTFHSARWDHAHDLAGERIAVIGTGASAIQFVPEIQPQAVRLFVFQRTPPWVMPRRGRDLSRLEQFAFSHLPGLQRVVRGLVYWGREWFAVGFTRRPSMLSAAERMCRRHLERQVHDPALRARLTPGYTLGCKRILISNDWYPAICGENVEVVSSPIREVRPRSIVTEDGVEREVDTIIFGTGFEVIDQPVARIVHGRDGVALADAWREGMPSYMGTVVAEFPNLFVLVGPNTGLGHSSQVFMIECQIHYVAALLRMMRERGVDVAEVTPAAQASYMEAVRRRMARTVWVNGGCTSWYLDGRGENTTLWPDFTWKYWLNTRRVEAAAFRFRRSGVPLAGPAAPPGPDGEAMADPPLAAAESGRGR